MPGPPAAVAAVRRGLDLALRSTEVPHRRVVVACSGGPDSLALALAASFVVPRLDGGAVSTLTVDHGLQSGSAQVAARAADQCAALGLSPCEVVAVDVQPQGSGVEQAARGARYDALLQAARRQDASAVLLGHTREDQAEQVLLGLARGSGARSLSGMPAARPLVGADGEPEVLLLRPFLQLDRRTTHAACRAVGLQPWHDPHNQDTRFARTRARALLPAMEEQLGPGLVRALARSADLLRVDADTLEEVSLAAYTALGPLPWPVATLLSHPPGIRTRLWRRVAIAGGTPGGSLTSVHLRAVDRLVSDWHGQGPVDLPGGLRIHRHQGQIWSRPPGPS